MTQLEILRLAVAGAQALCQVAMKDRMPEQWEEYRDKTRELVKLYNDELHRHYEEETV